MEISGSFDKGEAVHCTISSSRPPVFLGHPRTRALRTGQPQLFVLPSRDYAWDTPASIQRTYREAHLCARDPRDVPTEQIVRESRLARIL
ncbi:hypothetical protein PsYK624_114700 [Phanerochaete sordida]|uniref:Uncharacterized protein n=1 Tax=Phanerochaete sordida TaxID=48140 RepID=A0A9P3GGP5_9APHY|nr:hypothetical protein PsYK624_114700 [Phanerochaete sordida]